jgi:hypothetical protein
MLADLLTPMLLKALDGEIIASRWTIPLVAERCGVEFHPEPQETDCYCGESPRVGVFRYGTGGGRGGAEGGIAQSETSSEAGK